MDIGSFHKGFNGKSFTIIEKKKSKRDFIKYVAKETKIIPAKTHKDIFIKLEELIKKKSKVRRFIHAYMDEFDSIQHHNGTKSEKTDKLFIKIDNQIKKVSELVK
jgi:predicted AlkP superfamily pyrophosphatase or phosphodiesterase